MIEKKEKIKKTKINFISLGCAKNLTDSEEVMSFLYNNNCEFTDKKADITIINTCGFINDAIEESLDTIAGEYDKNSKLIVMGCLANSEQLARFPNLLASIQEPKEVIDVLKNYLASPLTSTPTNDPSTDKFLKLTPPHYAYLKISDGCDNSCSFCLIPSIKGGLRSMPADKILAEAKRLADSGVRELILIAQDTFVYNDDKTGESLIALLNELSHLNVWIRLHYIYPYKNIDKLITLMAEGKILPYLDMPLQHISKSILKKMKRPGDYESMLRKISAWREICPDLSIRSSFIVGFPGETNEDFNQLMDFLYDAKIDRVAFFQYSDVEGIESNNFDEKIDPVVIDDRYNTCIQRQQDISSAILQKRVGKVEDFIIDSYDKKQKLAIGRSKSDSPEVDGVVFISGLDASSVGTIQSAIITDADDYDLFATTKKVII